MELSNLRQAAEQALEALEWSKPHADASITYEEAITALRAALAEEAMQRLTDVHQEIEAALAEKNKCTHGVEDSCKECYMAEPEQEPVAWMWRDGTVTSDPDRADGTWTPLYTTPPQRKPLTDEEIEQAYRHIYHNVPDGSYRTTYYWIEQGIRYAEQAHGIKREA